MDAKSATLQRPRNGEVPMVKRQDVAGAELLGLDHLLSIGQADRLIVVSPDDSGDSADVIDARANDVEGGIEVVKEGARIDTSAGATQVEGPLAEPTGVVSPLAAAAILSHAPGTP